MTAAGSPAYWENRWLSPGFVPTQSDPNLSF